jgi:uncharacterized protein (TIGR02996 family)
MKRNAARLARRHSSTMPDLPQLLDAIRDKPDEGPRWLALAGWLADNGRDDEAAAVRVFWPTLRHDVTVSGMSVELTLRELARHAGRLGRRAREIEGREARE